MVKKHNSKESVNIKCNIYTIEINSLGELQVLINEEGRIVIDEDTIEIYDDFRK
jgi:hypothetical protein